MRQILIIALILVWNYSNGQTIYFPLEKGETMTYAFGSDIYGGTPYEDYKNDVRILEDTETIEGKEYFISESSTGSLNGNKTVITTYFRFGDEGSLISKNTKTSKEIVMMNSVPKIGDTFSSHNGGTTKVLDMDAIVKTPISTYNDCLMMETTEGQATYRAYFKKEIGMVATTLVKDGTEKLFIYLEN